jgi:hypothetical protein
MLQAHDEFCDVTVRVPGGFFEHISICGERSANAMKSGFDFLTARNVKRGCSSRLCQLNSQQSLSREKGGSQKLLTFTNTSGLTVASLEDQNSPAPVRKGLANQ